MVRLMQLLPEQWAVGVSIWRCSSSLLPSLGGSRGPVVAGASCRFQGGDLQLAEGFQVGRGLEHVGISAFLWRVLTALLRE